MKIGLLQQCERYTEEHVLALFRLYAYEELRYLPGGTLTWSAKLLGAQAAFEHLLELQGENALPKPTVLIGRTHEQKQSEASAFVEETQNWMVNQAQLIKLEWLPAANFTEN